MKIHRLLSSLQNVLTKSTVKLKEMALPQKNEGVTSILRSL